MPASRSAHVFAEEKTKEKKANARARPAGTRGLVGAECVPVLKERGGGALVAALCSDRCSG